MKVVGTGCGPGMLTKEAIAALQTATLVYGSDRALDLVRAHLSEGCETHLIADYRRLRDLPDHAVVLSTGDPMLAGLGYLPGEVIPGISSLQVAFARLKIPIVRGAAVSAHAKDHGAAIAQAREEVQRGRVVFLIADPAFDLSALAAALPPECRLAVCEDLGYPAERIALGTAAEPPEVQGGLFVVVAGAF